jgi:AraC family transcriptional regulator
MILNITPESAAGGCTPDEVIINRLPAVRAETRVELYRRLLKGRAFLEANYAQTADLHATARVACLSPFHFLRLFKTAFGRTPHQYLTELRLAVARRQLLETKQSVGEIGLSLGFENVNSFGRLFRRHQGITPQCFRRLSVAG